MVVVIVINSRDRGRARLSRDGRRPSTESGIKFQLFLPIALSVRRGTTSWSEVAARRSLLRHGGYAVPRHFAEARSSGDLFIAQVGAWPQRQLDTRGLATELGQEIVERFTTKVLTIRLKPQEPEG